MVDRSGGTENQIFDGNERDPDLETQPVFLESVLFNIF